MADFLLSLIGTTNDSFSIHRLRAVYTDLLRHIDLDNDHLGQRRGIDDDDVECHKKSSRFSFRKNVMPSIDNSVAIKTREESRDAPNSQQFFTNPTSQVSGNPVGICSQKVGLATAFRILAATKSPDKEGENHGAVAIREDSSVCGIQQAKALEKRVVELINQIGEIVVNADDRMPNREGTPAVRTDPVFEYFCEKCILSLFVEIAKEIRRGQKSPLESFSPRTKPPSSLSVRGVVWSASVKAQVYQTVSLLVSDSRNQSVMYYLLSNNYMNDLIKSILPLQQWTEPAMAKMLPPYTDLLKNLALQIAKDPNLFPFLTIENSSSLNEETSVESLSEHIEFPLFSAALEIATSVYSQSDSQTYATCLSIIVNLMQISYNPIQTWICQSSISQRILADHLCQRLLDRYNRITNLTRGPVVNCARHNSIARQLSILKDEMGMVNEIFWSGIRGMDVRLCESLLQRVVFVLLKNLIRMPTARPFLVVGLIDADVIPEPEAKAQVATFFFSSMFSNLLYVPFQRMLSVALFHQNSTPLWSNSKLIPFSKDSSEDYVLMPVLSGIVNNEDSLETCLNPFRQEIFKHLEGEYGEWRTNAAACLLQSALKTDAVDTDAVVMSEIICDQSELSLDHSIATFLNRSHKPLAITARALESTSYLGLMILYRNVMRISQVEDESRESVENHLSKSHVWNALKRARDLFCRKAMECRELSGISDIFLDLTEAVIKKRYTARLDESNSASYICHLSQYGSFQKTTNANFLVRQNRCISTNDVETARFYIDMGIHFRALCKVIDQLISDVEIESKNLLINDNDFLDTADTLTRTIGGLSDKPTAGTALDLTGRMSFRFQPTMNVTTIYSTTHLTLVLDPLELFVVRPMVQKLEENRGTIMFGVSLRNIIAAAVDQAWLHIAIRNPDSIRDQTLIEDGNMSLHFESVGTCLIVKQYLDRSREVLRHNLANKLPELFAHA